MKPPVSTEHAMANMGANRVASSPAAGAVGGDDVATAVGCMVGAREAGLAAVDSGVVDSAVVDSGALINANTSSFRRAMMLLPPARRDALLTLYALCRALDDAVDEAPDPQSAQQALQQWEKQMKAVFAADGLPDVPLAMAFQSVHQRYRFDRADMQALLDAMAQDANGPVLRPSLPELEQYCHGAAAAVGLMALHIFGDTGVVARRFAIALGQALQCTNILRDVVTDARQGRIYLPREWVGEQVTPAQIVADPTVIQPACRRMASRAWGYFAEADACGKQLSSRQMAPALAMRDVYALYWKKLAERQWLPPEDGRLAVANKEKMWLALRGCGYLLGKFKRVTLPPQEDASSPA